MLVEPKIVIQEGQSFEYLRVLESGVHLILRMKGGKISLKEVFAEFITAVAQN